MTHVWLVKQQGALRVWDATEQYWVTVSSWQGLADTVSVRANDKDVCLYIPTQTALSLTNELSTHQIKQLGVSGQQYLFEELALTPVEQLRIRYMAQGVKHHFYAMGASELEQWQQSAQLAGFKVTALLPDFVLLPNPQIPLGSEVVLYQDEEARLLKYSESYGTSVSYLSLLPRLLSNVDEIVYLDGNQSLKTDVDSGNLADEHTQKLQQICDDNGIVLTHSTQIVQPISIPSKHPLNFIEIKRSRLASPYLTLAASLLLLAGVVQMAADSLQWYQYQQAAIATKTATNDQFKSWFSDERLNPRVNVVAQVQPRLIQGESAQQTQLSTLNRVSPVIKQSNLVAQSLRWNNSNITISVKGARRDDIDQMQRTLSEQGIVANLGTVNPTNDGGVIGELTIPLSNSDVAADTQVS